MLTIQKLINSIKQNNTINRINSAIYYNAFRNSDSVTVMVTENINKVRHYYETAGFSVTSSKTNPLFLTISWHNTRISVPSTEVL